MLAVRDAHPAHCCQGYTRRDFLRVGALGFGGLTLANLLRWQALAAPNHGPLTGRSVVLLFLQGGPSHLETFDPKTDAPVEFASIFGSVATRLPGVHFGGHFPQMATRADRLAIVRSYGSANTGHTYQEVVSGGNSTEASMGSLYARIAGTNHPQNGLPTQILVLPEAVDRSLKLEKNFETDALPSLTHPGQLGPAYKAFEPQGGSTLLEDMQLQIARQRFDDRRALLSRLDRLKRHVETTDALAGVDRYQQQAFDIITGGIADAFDLSQEDPQIIARYDTSHLFRLEEATRWYDMRRSTNLLGRQMLLARRLCERGCGFVTVSDCGWDHHGNPNSPRGLGGMKWLGPQVDHAVAAFLDDVQERGLSDKILLVVTGEMGRTPRINNEGGRDHYGELTPLVFAGGGLKMGQVVGESDRYATHPTTSPYRPEHMLATIMHSLLDIGQLRLVPGIPAGIMRAIAENQPIRELI